MLAIGNEELREPLGPTTKCHRCGQQHQVESSGPSKVLLDGEWVEGPSGTLQFYRCGGEAYLCGIHGRLWTGASDE